MNFPNPGTKPVETYPRRPRAASAAKEAFNKSVSQSAEVFVERTHFTSKVQQNVTLPPEISHVILPDCWKSLHVLILFTFADVIHTVGPIAHGGVGEKESKALRACYYNSLRIAADNAARSVVRNQVDSWTSNIVQSQSQEKKTTGFYCSCKQN